MEAEGSEAAGSVAAAAPSETSAESSGPQQGPAAAESLQQGGSVNWGQATAQSPVGDLALPCMLLKLSWACCRLAGLLPTAHAAAHYQAWVFIARRGCRTEPHHLASRPPPQRVPRSQISRAHPAHAATGFGERTSAVLSALSGDDETALSAAEAAGGCWAGPPHG